MANPPIEHARRPHVVRALGDADVPGAILLAFLGLVTAGLAMVFYLRLM